MIVALLTADSPLWSAVSASVHLRSGFLVDFSSLRNVLPRRGTALDCDLLVVDLRDPDSDWVWSVRAFSGLATLAIVPLKTPPSWKRRLSIATRNELTFMGCGETRLLSNVRRFIGRCPAPQERQARFDDYTFGMPDRRVEIAEQGVLCLSEHKFRFATSLFLHCRVRLHWSLLQRLAWGEAVQPRATAVAAHASWARSRLGLDGLRGYELVSDGLHYELRRRRNCQTANVQETSQGST